MSEGLFITFEGGEGAGKSTQIALLQEYLESLGKTVVRTREPGGSVGAEEIRRLLVNGGTDRWDKLTELLLFSAARRDHLVKKIWPAMAAGQVVLSDRFADSTLAYQCFGYGFDEQTYAQASDLYQLIAGSFKPDLTVVLDLDVRLGLSRSKGRAGNTEQRFEDMALQFHENLRKGFRHLCETEPNRCVLIDASGSVDEVQAKIRQVVRERLFQ